jgi:hypothetical protein
MKAFKIIVHLFFVCSLNGITLGDTKVPDKNPQLEQHSAGPEESAKKESKGKSQKTISHPAILTEHFGEGFFASIPTDIYSAIPAEILKVFDNLKCEKTPYHEWLEEILTPMDSYLEKQKTLVKIVVVDKNEKPVKGVCVRLTEVRRLGDSGDLRECSDSYKPYKGEKTTDVDGKCVFDDIEAHSFYSVFVHLFHKAKFPKDNILMEIRESGFNKFEYEFVNVDRASLALGCKFMELILRNKDRFPEKEKESGFTIQRKIIIPEENTKNVIEIKVVSRKETNEASKNQDSAQSSEPKQTN